VFSTAVRVLGVSKTYRQRLEEPTLKQKVLAQLVRRHAVVRESAVLRDMSFEIATGEFVAIVGRNGAGKSTLLRILAGVVQPDEGEVTVEGRVVPILALGAGFAPELSGRRNVRLYGTLLGLSSAELDQKMDAIRVFAGVGDYFEAPVKHYSSGMYVRLAFAVAVHSNPDVMLIDEVLAVGDASYQSRSFDRITDLREAGTTIVVITHALEMAIHACNRALYIDGGRLIADGNPESVIATYLREVVH
jgi:lipopolysaccharide transport system ATP-binding protein